MKYTCLFTAMTTLAMAGCMDAPSTPSNATPASASRAADHENTETRRDTTDTRRDNSAMNVRDRASDAKTSGDQNENQRDINTTADIRKRVVDTEMSVNAQNVKIMTQDGKVVLRGPVASEDEKSQIAKLARDVAGAANVDNQLEVQP